MSTDAASLPLPSAPARVVARLRALLPGRAEGRSMRRDPRLDLLAGLTVAVVALPLALAFGIGFDRRCGPSRTVVGVRSGDRCIRGARADRLGQGGRAASAPLEEAS